VWVVDDKLRQLSQTLDAAGEPASSFGSMRVTLLRMTAHTPYNSGDIVVICGPMFAGKTTELVRRVRQAQQQQRSICLIKPAQDNRWDARTIQTHDGASMPAIALTHAEQVIEVAGDASLVVIDEAHFFGEALLQPCLQLRAAQRSVMVVGVDTDHRGEPFDPFPSLIAIADTVLRLQGVCAQCGAPSTNTQRLTHDDRHIVVGGAETYQPRCQACFNPPSNTR